MPIENSTAFIGFSLSPLFRIMSVIQLFIDYSFIDQLLRNTIDCSVLSISLNVKFEVGLKLSVLSGLLIITKIHLTCST